MEPDELHTLHSSANMVLWVDKHRPTKLDKLTLHTKITERLSKMVESGDFPHLLFYGPSGAGKKTRVMAVLRELYGSGVGKVKVDLMTFKPANTTKTVEIHTVASNYHIEMNPSDVGLDDRLVVQEVIQEIAKTHTINSEAQRAFKVVVLNEVDKLSKDAQQALRRTMEKYTSTCRLIMLCESTSRVMEPLRSRCLPIRVPAPTVDEISETLQAVAKKEGVELPEDFGRELAVLSGRNLRKALLMLESAKVEEYPFQPDQRPRISDWERFVDELGRIITEEQTPQRLLLARGKVYELLTNCIPAEVVLKTLVKVLLKRLDDQLKHQTIHWAAYYEHRMQCGTKQIFHIEAFMAKFMALYKRWVLEMWS